MLRLAALFAALIFSSHAYAVSEKELRGHSLIVSDDFTDGVLYISKSGKVFANLTMVHNFDMTGGFQCPSLNSTCKGFGKRARIVFDGSRLTLDNNYGQFRIYKKGGRLACSSPRADCRVIKGNGFRSMQ